MADRKPFLLRLDPSTLDALQRWANDEFRSLNGQVEYLLTQALREAGRLKGRRQKVEERSQKLEDRRQKTEDGS
jgi:hypothetical protein